MNLLSYIYIKIFNNINLNNLDILLNQVIKAISIKKKFKNIKRIMNFINNDDIYKI